MVPDSGLAFPLSLRKYNKVKEHIDLRNTMPKLPPREQQIVLAHLGLISRVVTACQAPSQVPDLEDVLQASLANGWSALVGASRKILAGRRGTEVFEGLDEEDRVIVEAMLRGIRDPSTLPAPEAGPDPSAAAPGLAAMIQAAATGNAQALRLIAGMAEQMSRVGGDMARLAAVIRPLVNGERDPDALCRGMGAQGRSLVMTILDELGRLTQQ